MKVNVLRKAIPLKSGDRIGLVATGSPLSSERLNLGVSTLEMLGFKPVLPFDPSKFYGRTDHGFAAESAAERSRAVASLLADHEVKALLAVRGAYGSLDVLPLLDFQAAARAKKLLIGCSDITALLAQWMDKASLAAIHGATLGSSFADYATDGAAKESVDLLIRMITEPDFRLSAPVQALRAGNSRGALFAGNLTMLLTLLGTPWDVDYTDRILVVEDVGESPYRIHRAFVQLKLAGKLDRLRGLVFGRFAKCEAKHGPGIDDVFQMVAKELLNGTTYPIVKGLEAGHWGKNIPLPLGIEAEIDGETFRVLNSPIEGS
ncbi:MAG: LD-carboxypeptidase [Bdellovibrionota bacterium]